VNELSRLRRQSLAAPSENSGRAEGYHGEIGISKVRAAARRTTNHAAAGNILACRFVRAPGMNFVADSASSALFRAVPCTSRPGLGLAGVLLAGGLFADWYVGLPRGRGHLSWGVQKCAHVPCGGSSRLERASHHRPAPWSRRRDPAAGRFQRPHPGAQNAQTRAIVGVSKPDVQTRRQVLHP